MLNRVRAALRRDDGFALVDAIIGVTAMSAIVITLISTSVAASHAMTAAASQAERQMYLRSFVNDLSSNPDAVQLTVKKSPVQFGDSEATVSVIRVDDGPSRTVIRATVNATTSKDCTSTLVQAPTANEDPTCLVTEVSVDRRVLGPEFAGLPGTLAQRSVDSAAGANVSDGVVGTFTPESGTTTVKWVAGIEAGAVPGRLTFYQNGVVIGSQAFAAGTKTYLYGPITVTSANPVTVQWAGGPGLMRNLLLYTTP